MIVMKFGGTSVGSPDRIRSLAARVRERLDRRPVVVVSALSGVTDQLIRGAWLALDRNPEGRALAREIRNRHADAARELLAAGPARDRLMRLVEQAAGELLTLYTGVEYLGELTPRSLDAISGLGERLSCEIVAEALAAEGLPAVAVDARKLVVTDEGFGRALPLAG